MKSAIVFGLGIIVLAQDDRRGGRRGRVAETMKNMKNCDKRDRKTMLKLRKDKDFRENCMKVCGIAPEKKPSQDSVKCMMRCSMCKNKDWNQNSSDSKKPKGWGKNCPMAKCRAPEKGCKSVKGERNPKTGCYPMCKTKCAFSMPVGGNELMKRRNKLANGPGDLTNCNKIRKEVD